MLPADIFTDAHKTGLGAILCQGKCFENKLCTTRFGSYGYRVLVMQIMFILACYDQMKL